jgi:hypothetical protein
MTIADDIDKEKLAEIALAILSLTAEGDYGNARAWKGMDWRSSSWRSILGSNLQVCSLYNKPIKSFAALTRTPDTHAPINSNVICSASSA